MSTVQESISITRSPLTAPGIHPGASGTRAHHFVLQNLVSWGYGAWPYPETLDQWCGFPGDADLCGTFQPANPSPLFTFTSLFAKAAAMLSRALSPFSLALLSASVSCTAFRYFIKSRYACVTLLRYETVRCTLRSSLSTLRSNLAPSG